MIYDAIVTWVFVIVLALIGAGLVISLIKFIREERVR